MSSILSTKILSASQKELLLNANLGFVEYDAIKIEFNSFEISFDSDYYVFTSKNGVRAFLSNGNHIKKPSFCVGERTKSFLEENGFKVIEIAQNSLELAKIITKRYKNNSFIIFSGNLRRPELTERLDKNNIWYKENIIYNTLLNYRKFDRIFEGVLFFSPSGVQSFSKENKLSQFYAFCIGDTTAAEAKKHTDQVVVANKTTVENVLIQAIKKLNSHTQENNKIY